MKVTIQIVVNDDQGQTYSEDLLEFHKGVNKEDLVGLSLTESKQLLKTLQATIIQHQVQAYAEMKRCCPHCKKPRRIKGQYTLQYRTLFGIVPIPSQRLYHCDCQVSTTQTLSPLSDWLSDHNSPELQQNGPL